MEYKLYSLNEIDKAIKKQRKRKPPVWDGPDDLHHSISATSPAPSWHLSEEGLEYHKERGRNRTDIIFYVMFMLGFHQGAVQQSELTDTYIKILERMKSHE